MALPTSVGTSTSVLPSIKYVVSAPPWPHLVRHCYYCCRIDIRRPGWLLFLLHWGPPMPMLWGRPRELVII